MTTIAIKDGVIAADTNACSNGDSLTDARAQKLFPTKDHVSAVCGDLCASIEFMAWMDRGFDDPPPVYGSGTPDFHLVRIYFDRPGEVHQYTNGGRSHFCLEYDEGIAAFGSGREIALGAMHAGASAKKAVEIAAKLDAYTRGPVVSVPLIRRANDEA